MQRIFSGRFSVTLPAGMLSDRFGRVPLIRLGLVITVIKRTSPCRDNGSRTWSLRARFIEGIGAGCFVAAAMSYSQFPILTMCG